MEPRPKMWTEVEAAEYVGVSVETMRAWRCRGGGPSFAKIGKRLVRYRRTDLDQFIERGMRRTTSSPQPAA